MPRDRAGRRPEGAAPGPRQGWVASTTLHVIGISLAAVSAGMLACSLLEALTSRRDTAALAVSGLLTGVAGGLLWYLTRPGAIRKRQVFATVAWTWILITAVGALPFILAGTFAYGGAGLVEQVVNSLFESASGFSASGSTVLADFDTPGRGLMMYRQLTHWYGGMGVVVLAVAVLPFLGVGGLELVSAEAPGPSSDRLTPRVSETARRLWIVYIGFTAGAALAFFAADGFSSLYDAVAHAFTVAATGGFSVHAESIGHYDSVAVETVAIVCMILGGTSFSLHWRAVADRPLPYHRNSEFRSYLTMLGLAATIIVLLLWLENGLPLGSSIRAGVFTVVSLGTSTGLSNATGPGSPSDYVLWVAGAQLVLLLLMVVGGCSGSTSGGIKVLRMRVLGLTMLRSVRHTQTPRAVIPIRLGRDVVSETVVSRVAGFFLLHFVLMACGLLAVTALEGDLESSLGAVVSALGNMGPALNEAGPTSNYAAAFSQPARLVLALLMVIGRLEIFPILLAAMDLAVRGRAALRHGPVSFQHLSRRLESFTESRSDDP
ncbi:MAG: TrkH family potassium uptake protein [Acidimicrobiaceae bacterium]|nr:TrkH family potassium uptake protein [Acidimicrobiaceae bacterium]